MITFFLFIYRKLCFHLNLFILMPIMAIRNTSVKVVSARPSYKFCHEAINYYKTF